MAGEGNAGDDVVEDIFEDVFRLAPIGSVNIFDRR
jgi:hypothetical protein